MHNILDALSVPGTIVWSDIFMSIKLSDLSQFSAQLFSARLNYVHLIPLTVKHLKAISEKNCRVQKYCLWR